MDKLVRQSISNSQTNLTATNVVIIVRVSEREASLPSFAWTTPVSTTSC